MQLLSLKNCFSLFLTISLWFFQVPSPIQAQTWTGGEDATNWSVQNNWNNAVTSSSDLSLNAIGSFNDSNSDLDVDLFFGASFEAKSISISGDYTANLENGTATTGATHAIANDGVNSNTLTFTGANANGYSIEYTPPSETKNSFTHNVRFNSEIAFTNDASIRNNGVSQAPTQQLQFNRGINATGKNLKFSTGTNTNRSAIRFTSGSLSQSDWGNTDLSEGRIMLFGSRASSTMDLGNGTINMSTAGASSIVSNPGDTGNHTLNNDIVIGTGGSAMLRVYGGTSVESFTIAGNITSAVGSTGRLTLDADNQDQLIIAGEIEIGGELYVGQTGGGSDAVVSFNGTIVGAGQGVRFVADPEGDGSVNGTGTIKFDINSAVTSGAANFGGLAWDVEQNFEIDNFDIEFSLTNGPLTESAYTLIDYSHTNGALVGTDREFASVTNIPTGYVIDFDTDDQIRLVSAVPEPAFFSYLGISIFGTLIRRRKG